MRLRPFGDSGPLVASFAFFEDYLLRHGRDWERYAYIKARPITAPERYAELYAAAVRPFVYRRYIDYGVFESLREMKALIEREVERRELADHVKLGPGGIREIEFIVQAFQLIRGGRFRQLQSPALLSVLPMLDGDRLLPSQVVADCRRRLCLSAAAREPPADARRCADAPSAERRGYAGPHRRRHGFDRLGGAARGAEPPPRGGRPPFQVGGAERRGRCRIAPQSRWTWADFGTVQAEEAALADALGRAGFAEAAEPARQLMELRASSFVRRLDEPGRKRLQALLPLLIADVAASTTPQPVLRRVLKVLEAIGQRSVYFALLQESGAARTRLVELCGRGDFLAEQIATHPLLLDELLDERLFSQLPSRESLARDLDLTLQQGVDEDPERQVEALRHFQRVALFRIAVADLTGRLPLMKVSDRLTEVAELIVERAMQFAWQQITAQFGIPMCGEGEERRPVQIAAVGYGKLGGRELGYSSDLDLVFLHDSVGERSETSAPRPIDNQIFFVRLAQRIVHLLTLHSAAGRLYEVDVRLRPSGKGGMLITSIRAFGEYQRLEAWTWEHQALLHARSVAGAPELRAQFESVRIDTLQHHLRRETLRDEVRSMRERMRKELAKAPAGEFDIKQGEGGVADIEFLAQYWALLWAKDYPAVAMFSDTIRQLESVASADLVPQETVDVLVAAYTAYRARTHHLSLDFQPPRVPAAQFEAQRVEVTRIWNEVMLDGAAAL